MPIIKSAKKRMKQSEKRRKRNYPVRSTMKTNIKKFLKAVKDGDKKEAENLLKACYKIIDTAAKKNIIHKNNAARKKSRLAKTLANIGEAKPKVEKKEEKKESKKAEKPEKNEKKTIKWIEAT